MKPSFLLLPGFFLLKNILASSPNEKDDQPSFYKPLYLTLSQPPSDNISTITSQACRSNIPMPSPFGPQSLPILETQSMLGSKKFDLVKCLREAMNVDLEARLRSNKRSPFEEQIYQMHKVLTGPSKWTTIFKKVVGEWGMFGDLEQSSVPLAFNGFLRICEASGVVVKQELRANFKSHHNNFKTRMTALFAYVFKYALSPLEIGKIYQTLLLLYKDFLQHANREELDAVKMNRTTKRQNEDVIERTSSTSSNEPAPEEMEITPIQSRDARDSFPQTSVNNNLTLPGSNTSDQPLTSRQLGFHPTNASQITNTSSSLANNNLKGPANAGTAPKGKAFKYANFDLGFSEYLLHYHGIPSFILDDLQTNEPPQQDDIHQNHFEEQQDGLDLPTLTKKRKLDRDKKDELRTSSKKPKTTNN